MLAKEISQEEREVKEFAKRLAVLYELFNWRWSDEDIPDEKRIEKMIYYLIKRVVSIRKEDGTSECSVGTGGITVHIDDVDNLDITWSLEKNIYIELTNKLIKNV